MQPLGLSLPMPQSRILPEMGLICIIHNSPKDLGLNFDMSGEVIQMELILHIDIGMALAKY